MTEADAQAAIIQAGRQLYERGILASYEGNLSVLLDDGGILTTATGSHKGNLNADDLVRLDPAGSIQGRTHPSSELPMHLAIYAERPDVRGIVHAHPPVATGYAVAGRPLPAGALAEIVAMLGCVPTAPYATPSTQELADSVRESIRQFDVVLLANHGAVAVGPDLEQAKERMVQLEHFAQIALVSHLLGGARTLTPAQIQALSRLRESSGARPVPPVCYPCNEESGTITLTSWQLVELISEAVRTIRES